MADAKTAFAEFMKAFEDERSELQKEIFTGLQKVVESKKTPTPADPAGGEDLTATEADLKRYQQQIAAMKAGIPLRYADRLIGNSIEKLTADAEAFADLLGVQPEQFAPPLGNPDSFTPGPGFGDQMHDIMRRADGSGWARVTEGELDDLFGKIKR